MNFLSYILPKLAWFIPLCILFFLVYIALQNRRDAIDDKNIQSEGIEIDAKILKVSYDSQQRINNHLVAVLTLDYKLGNISVIASRGVIFSILDKGKVKEGEVVRIKVSKQDHNKFLFVDYKSV
ncbi:hypothetical protein [Erwinia aphidicola]|uniref:hypothetical protein n=1 Tax=Erwinia aphidicola TaxID=68334 RepID=UPI003CF0DA1B